MYLSRSVPDEIWLNIMNYLSDERETPRNAIDADCAVSVAATRIYWANMLSEHGLLDEFEDQPEYQQPFYAIMIHMIVIIFKPSYSRHEGYRLNFPLLRCLTVGRDGIPFGQCRRTYAKIKDFVGALLRNLDVGCERQTSDDTQPITDNFLPRLSASICLVSLRIRSRIKNVEEWGNMKQHWADQVAEEVVEQAPLLQTFGKCEDGLMEVTEMVHKSWENIVTEREMGSWRMIPR
jgi:hypothetical protein